jgi:hypothetical protein
MKIGIIGFSESVNEMLQDSRNLAFSGYYTSENKSLDSKTINKHPDPQSILENSDILYINRDAKAFEIAKNAIKASTHLFFESPFIFTENQFNELFDLADENNVLLKFNQKVLQKEIYKKVTSKKEPDLLKVRVENPTEKNEEALQKKAIFEFASIFRNNIKSGIRKINACTNKQSGKYFTLNIYLDNDSNCELLFNSISREQQYSVELFYPDRLVFVDLINNNLAVTTKNNSKETEAKQKPNLIGKELNDFITNLPKLSSMPITIREENQYLLYVTYRLAEKIFQF